MYLFADASKIYKSINSLNDHDIDDLIKWFSNWLLTHSSYKCKVLKVLKNTFRDYDYVMQNHTLQFISQEKDLGVIFNFRLSFNDKVSKANKILGLTRRTSTILNEVTLVQLHKAFLRPHLEFSNCAWSSPLKKHIDIIENVQRTDTKLVSSVSHQSYPHRLARMNLSTLSYRRARGDMIEVFMITSNIYDPKETKFFMYRDHTVTRGSQIKRSTSIFFVVVYATTFLSPHLQKI